MEKQEKGHFLANFNRCSLLHNKVEKFFYFIFDYNITAQRSYLVVCFVYCCVWS